jgi:hypothetical protein
MADQDQFGMAWAKIQDLVSSMYGRFLASDLPSEVIVKELIDLDLKTILFEDFKLNGEMNTITNNYVKTLKSMEAFSNVPEVTLQTLIRADVNFFSAKVGEQSELMKRLMIESIVGRQSEAVFAESLISVGWREKQANSLVNDSLRRFSRNVTKEMANNSPDDFLYIFDGPVDDRTSDECLDIIAQGPMTLAEIESSYPGVFQAGSHFNCRHEFVRYTSKEQYQGEEVKALA